MVLGPRPFCTVTTITKKRAPKGAFFVDIYKNIVTLLSMNYTDTFVGHFSYDDNGKEFIKDVRKLLKGTGYRLWVRGGNPDRKQFSKNYYQHAMLRQSLPLNFASYVRFYLRDDDRFRKPTRSLVFCKELIDGLKVVYLDIGMDVTSTVPSKFKK